MLYDKEHWFFLLGYCSESADKLRNAMHTELAMQMLRSHFMDGHPV